MIPNALFREVYGMLCCSFTSTISLARNSLLSPVTRRMVSSGKYSLNNENTKINHYDILRISPNANQSQIKRAYYKLSLIYHPDKNQSSVESKSKFAAVSEAYQVLSDEKARLTYDRSLNGQFVTTYSFSEENLKNHKKRKLRYPSGYDEWTRAHYGTVLEDSRRRSFARMQSVESMKKASQKRVINQRIMQILIVLCALFGGLVYNVKA